MKITETRWGAFLGILVDLVLLTGVLMGWWWLFVFVISYGN